MSSVGEHYLHCKEAKGSNGTFIATAEWQWKSKSIRPGCSIRPKPKNFSIFSLVLQMPSGEGGIIGKLPTPHPACFTINWGRGVFLIFLKKTHKVWGAHFSPSPNFSLQRKSTRGGGAERQVDIVGLGTWMLLSILGGLFSCPKKPRTCPLLPKCCFYHCLIVTLAC